VIFFQAQRHRKLNLPYQAFQYPTFRLVL
jgi:hypothetical protein